MPGRIVSVMPIGCWRPVSPMASFIFASGGGSGAGGGGAASRAAFLTGGRNFRRSLTEITKHLSTGRSAQADAWKVLANPRASFGRPDDFDVPVRVLQYSTRISNLRCGNSIAQNGWARKLLGRFRLERGWEAGIRTPITWSRGAGSDAGDVGCSRFCWEIRTDRRAVSGRTRAFRAQIVKFSSRGSWIPIRLE